MTTQQIKSEFNYFSNSTGVLNYSFIGGIYRLVIDIDPGIVHYARALVPKSIKLNKTKFDPHISLIREKELKFTWKWEQYEGKIILFDYDPNVYFNDTYYWLNVHNNNICSIREELGLEPYCDYTKPPDGRECFHITIGNLK